MSNCQHWFFQIMGPSGNGYQSNPVMENTMLWIICPWENVWVRKEGSKIVCPCAIFLFSTAENKKMAKGQLMIHAFATEKDFHVIEQSQWNTRFNDCIYVLIFWYWWKITAPWPINGQVAQYYIYMACSWVQLATIESRERGTNFQPLLRPNASCR